jgi:hypothetical protein
LSVACDAGRALSETISVADHDPKPAPEVLPRLRELHRPSPLPRILA